MSEEPSPTTQEIKAHIDDWRSRVQTIPGEHASVIPPVYGPVYGPVELESRPFKIGPFRLDPKPVPTSSGVESTLSERGARYGRFTSHAEITQGLKDLMHKTDNWAKLQADQKEALEMIAHKIGRVLNGDPNYADSWHDIAGYATLVEKELHKKYQRRSTE
jgi:hypothetical protein